ncbi:dTDP-4-amino-4,6-dideoxygalactose transaminase [Candidatus Colwellia aromaticivorans]|uniref:dTDP-4-amino-4,6-dideoxygalactose transaminase n=1 Tax=Candidatus Colwellia aromaticivorans TaxID=2267621 RepID=UPI000DF2E666|nr:dTDP-4-amino-4,6-dideoxygalactose transaminase [Candidatus Colwellia aromaticivorans]
MENNIKFNQPLIAGNELKYVQEVLASGRLAGDLSFTKKCQTFMEQRFGAKKVLLTTSCTSALEMAAILCNIKEGDEVIMPSFTFVSTANAFLLRGAKIKFVDIRPDTFNIDENLIEQAITSKTKAIVPVHYASIACEMDKINAIAKAHDLFLIEDAAQAVDTQYKDQYMGTLGDAGTYSFHETKNFVAGECGALVLNREDWIERAEILREKGTNRSQFHRGHVDKYTWVDIGSSYVPSDLLAAVLLGQFEAMDTINNKRQSVAELYRQCLQPLADNGYFAMPIVPEHCTTNNHMFSLYCSSAALRNRLLKTLNKHNIQAVFHYIPLHNSPFAIEQGFNQQPLPVTENVADCLLRLPMYPGLSEQSVLAICQVIIDELG